MLLRNLALACALLAPSFARAQCDPQWQPGGGLQGIGGTVYATTVWDPDGAGPLPSMLVAAGQFQYAGTVAASNIAAWNGTAWQSFGGTYGGSIRALAVYNGELIFGGNLGTVIGDPIRY